MRKMFSVLLLVSIGLITMPARADTIHLKNGSVLKGKVISFADDLFVVMLDTGSARYMSRAMIYMGDVARIEFDSSQNVTSDSGNDAASANSNDKPSGDNGSSILPSVAQPRVEIAKNSLPLSGEQPRTGDTQPPAREPEQPQPDPASTSSTRVPEKAETEPAPRKLTGMVRTANIDVIATRDWTSTGLIVKRGDLIRINANGSVTLNPDTEQISGPEGSDTPDPRKLMPDRPTGALIGVIGADNDDFIFIGRSAEFTAVRDGLLFLSINEGTLSDNQGSYKAIIELQAQSTSNQ